MKKLRHLRPTLFEKVGDSLKFASKSKSISKSKKFSTLRPTFCRRYSESRFSFGKITIPNEC